MTASLPEEVMRSRSTDGNASITASAKRTSRSVGAP